VVALQHHCDLALVQLVRLHKVLGLPAGMDTAAYTCLDELHLEDYKAVVRLLSSLMLPLHIAGAAVDTALGLPAHAVSLSVHTPAASECIHMCKVLHRSAGQWCCIAMRVPSPGVCMQHS
jgi:hypothetical protein